MDGVDAWSIDAIAAEFFSDLVAEPQAVEFDANGVNTGVSLWSLKDLGYRPPVWEKPRWKIIPSWDTLRKAWRKR